MKKFLLPPLAPVVLLLSLCALTYLSETSGAVRMIDGSPDNAPMMASAILAIGSPVVFVVLGMLNALAWLLDRLVPKVHWAGTVIMIGIGGLILACVFYSPKVDSSVLIPAGMAFGLTFMVFVPMAFIRHWVDRPKIKPARVSAGRQ